MDYYVRCRACLTEDSEMYYLHAEFDHGLSLTNILIELTSIKIDEDDGLSPYLCKSCADVVVDFFNFRNVFQQNDLHIKSLIEEELSKVENEETEFTDTNDNLEKNLESENNADCSNNTIYLNSIDEICDKEQYVVLNGLNEFDLETIQSVKYSCTECDSQFLNNHYFQQHMLQKHKNIIFDFDEYVSKTNVRIPKKIIEKNELLQCKDCEQQFKTYPEISEHIKTHKNFICDQCGVGFLKLAYLNDHAEIHSTGKNHICPICNKAFKRRTVLLKHKKIHTHPRHYVCEICGDRFNNKGTLNTHIQLKHIKDRNFSCKICGEKFPMKATLEKHIFRHSNRSKDHVCSICNMAYKDKSSLNRHNIDKHSDRPKPRCEVCGAEYCSKTNLSKHMRKHGFIKLK